MSSLLFGENLGGNVYIFDNISPYFFLDGFPIQISNTYAEQKLRDLAKKISTPHKSKESPYTNYVHTPSHPKPGLFPHKQQ